MDDHFSLCVADFKTQLQTLTSYFPASEDGSRAAGWQVSENDQEILAGGVYFATIRPGAFAKPLKAGTFLVYEWHITLSLYMHFTQYDSIWSSFRDYRAAILNLEETAPLRNHGIFGQGFSAQGEAGFITDEVTRQFYNIVAQVMDVTINQRVLVTRGV